MNAYSYSYYMQQRRAADRAARRANVAAALCALVLFGGALLERLA